MITGFENSAAALRRQFPLFRKLSSPLHYLDNAATAQMHESAFAIMDAHDSGSRANVQRGNHRLAEAANVAYEEARGAVARYLNAHSPAEIVFTSGATSAINIVAGAFGALLSKGDTVIVSQAEHHSNFLPWQRLVERGVRFMVIPLAEDGRIDLDALGAMVDERCKLVAVTHGSNVTGALTDLTAVARIAHAVGAWVLADGAQVVQHGPVDIQALGIDFYAFSGHKCFGPTGVGVLWGRQDALANLPPFMTGGGMVERVGLACSTYLPSPQRFEVGTPPITQAIGLAAVLGWMSGLDWSEIHVDQMSLLSELKRGLSAIPGLRIVGPTTSEGCLPLVSFVMGDHHPHDICQILDRRAVAVRGGHMCAQPMINHFGAIGVTRASLALYNDIEDVRQLLDGLTYVADVLA